MEFQLDNRSPSRQIPEIDFRGELNDEQYAAVTARPGPALVLAGAGSGKTRTLTFRVAYLLSQGVRPGEILLLTFTNKAAREMLHRVEDLTGVERRHFWGGTFHHIGHRILRIHGEDVGLKQGFTLMDQSDAESLLSDTVKETDPGFFKDKAHPRARLLGDMISMSRNTCLPFGESVERYHPQHEELIGRMLPLVEAYARRKLATQVVDYDDLLEYLLKLLREQKEVCDSYQQRFRYVLVDEYQDTNILQANIVDLLGAHHRVMAVGDDAQCIYSWRGANYDNIITFPDRHPGTHIYKIETNYRSTPDILALANGVLASQAPGLGFKKALIADRPNGEKPYLVPAMDTREQASFIIKRVEGLVQEGRRLSDIAVLYRAHFQALDLQMELSRRGIPFLITSGVRFFEQAHIRDLVAMLRFAYNPLDVPAFRRITTLLPKIGEKTALKLHALARESAPDGGPPLLEALQSAALLKKVPAAARDEWPQLVLSLSDIQAASRSGSTSEAVQVSIEGWYGDYLRGAYANYISRMEDLKSLVGFAERYGDLQEFLAQLILLNSETSDRSVDNDEDALRLTTVHQAKGLEFPVVFVIGAAEGLFPLRRALEEGDIEEERRLFYVAVTRARDELYLCFPMINRGNGPAISMKPSQFLQDLPDQLYETLRLQRQRYW